MTISPAPSRFAPPLRPLHGPTPAPLPTPMTPLVGRERELALGATLVRRDDVRLLTVTGPGGIGKTRLAVEIGRSEVDAYPDGVVFVPLAVVTDADDVATAVVRALGLQEVIGLSAQESLVAALTGTVTLLVLDNFEHVLAAAPLLTALLAACPRVKVVVTSRSLLRVAGEFALPVPPLVLPEPDAVVSPDDVSRSPAVRLFLDRVQALAPAFALSDETAPMVARLCRHMDGLPLAIELAAAQSAVLGPAGLLARIQARLPLPVAGPRDAPSRLRSIGEAVAWSYDLLTPDEQRLFRRTSVFVGGFTLDAAEAVTSSPVVDGLASLVFSSLLQPQAWEGDARFVMLETIRSFASDQLAASGEEDVVRDAHAGWCLALAEASSLATMRPGGARELRRLEAELPNLRVALVWLERRGDDGRLLPLATALGRFWYAHGHFAEGRGWLERALRDPRGATPHLRARALVELGQLRDVQGESARDEELLGESITVLRAHGDAVALAGALVWQGWMAAHRGDLDGAEGLLEEALDLAGAIDDPDVAAAAAGRALANLGVVAHQRGDLETARIRYERGLSAYRDQGNVLGVVRLLRDLGDVARDQGDLAGAVAAYHECLNLLGDQGEPIALVNALNGSALIAVAMGQPGRAARLLGAAEAARERFVVAVFLPTERAAQERTVAGVRAALGERGYRTAWLTGRALTPAAVTAEVAALASLSEAPGPALDRAGVRLSPREADVLRLLVAGHPNRAIAEALFLSVRTVEAHVARIMTKLGVRTRTAAAGVALATGLVELPAHEPA